MDTNDWNDAERRVERAQELFEQRKWQEALDELLAATTINPYNGSWFFNIGLTLDEMGRHDEAIDAYRRALTIEPDDLQALQHLGNDLHQTGQFVAAIRTFEQIESLDATFEPSYCGRILAYSELGQHDKAEEMFYLARLYKEHCPVCYYNIGCSLADRGLYDKAVFCWTKTLDTAGAAPGGAGHAEVHVRIAEALWNKGDLEHARQHFVLGLRQDPGSTQTLLDLSDLLVEMNRWDEAGEKIRRAIELSPEDPASYFCHGRWLLHRDEDESAIAALKRCLQLDPTFPGAHLLLGQLHQRRRELALARQHLRAELMLRPEEPGILMDLANLLMDVGEARAAVACLKRLTQLQPDHASAWQNLAVAQCLRGRFGDGIAACHEALRLDPRNLGALHNLALAYSRMGDWDQALLQARRGLSIARRDPALERLEFRLRVLKLRAGIISGLRRMFGIAARRA
jgi:tetratricopeptide (TPR) repeat protein